MDKKKKVELEVLNISNSQEQAGAYALVLGEVDGARQLPVIIGASEAQAMLISLKGIVPATPVDPQPFRFMSGRIRGKHDACPYL